MHEYKVEEKVLLVLFFKHSECSKSETIEINSQQNQNTNL